MLGPSRPLRLAAVRRDRRSAQPAAVWDGPIATIDDPREADSAFDVGLPILPIASIEADVPGHPSVAGAHCSLDALELAVGLARSRVGRRGRDRARFEASAVRHRLLHPGQTEFVAERCGVAPAMSR